MRRGEEPQLEGVPIAPQAQSPTVTHWSADENLYGEQFAIDYSIPKDSMDAVIGFYEANLPVGSPLGSWNWCRVEIFDEPPIHSFHWSQGKRVLVVTVMEDMLSITTDESGPCVP